MKPKVIAVAGPTASGKTAMAISLAAQVNGEIVSADSRLVYKGFNIAAAKPDMKERQGIPHHLIDIVEPEFDYSVGNYYDDARKAIYDILSRGKTPIVAGGTGLYFRILLENYNLPRVEEDVSTLSNSVKSRKDLYERINKRVDMMVEQGLIEETKYLLKKHGRIKNFVCTIGYQEILSYLDGEWTLEEALDKLKQHTRNYAKRQLTWFRKNPELEINI